MLKIKEMEKVKIPNSKGTYKCVILSNGKNSIFRADNGEYHDDVAKISIKKDSKLNGYKAIGGGRIIIGESKLEVYGYSIGFGHMDKSVVESLVGEYAKENEIEFINRTGEGY